jgi:3-methyladenine DNA glycosylase Tag
LESTEKPESVAQTEDEDIANMVLDEEMEDAALKIQAAFRGHQVRKTVEETSDSLKLESTEKPESVAQTEDEDIANMVLDEEMEDAALKIQAAFRGHQVRKTVEETSDSLKLESTEKPEESESVAQTEDEDIANMVLDEEMEDAALKIQAAFRGHQVRKTVEETSDSLKSESTEKPKELENVAQTEDEDIANMVLDEEMEDAALKIQAAFRGQQVRKTVEETCDSLKLGSTEKSESVAQTEDEDIANMVLDEEMEDAALKIQAAFRGHQVRKTDTKSNIETVEERELSNDADNAELLIGSDDGNFNPFGEIVGAENKDSESTIEKEIGEQQLIEISETEETQDGISFEEKAPSEIREGSTEIRSSIEKKSSQENPSISIENAEGEMINDSIQDKNSELKSEEPALSASQKSLQMSESLEDMLIQQISNHDSAEKSETISEEQEMVENDDGKLIFYYSFSLIFFTRRI